MRPAVDRAAGVRRALALFIAAAAWLPAAGLAQEAEALAGRPISLRQAVAETLRGSYRVQLAEAAVASRAGARQEAAGMFDPLLFVDSNLMQQRREILSRTRKAEIERRFPIEFLAIATLDDPRGILDQLADGLIENIDSGGGLSLLFEDCVDGQTRVVVQLEGGGTVTVCLSTVGEPEGIVLEGDLGVIPEIEGLEDYDLSPGNLRELARLLRLLDALGDDLADDIEADLRAAFNDVLRNLARSLRLTAAALRAQRARLGDIPADEVVLDLRIEAGHRWTFRNGVMFSTGLSLTGREDNFAGKPLDPERGDKTAPNTFTVNGGLRLDTRLGKGRGRIAAAGPEMASIASLDAARQLLVHTASREALATARAYWRLGGAQARYRHLLDSIRQQSVVLDAVRKLIDAEELPRAEAYRAEARYAEVHRQAAAAAQEVITAQLALLEAMGGTTDRVAAAPLASEPPAGAGGLAGDVDYWVGEALRRRRDLAAAADTSRASAILARTAKANLRREVDLSLNLSYAGYYESFDKRLYDFDGFREAAGGHLAGPSYGLVVKFTLPVKNDTARGRLVQAESALARSRVVESDLERQIRLRLNDLVRLYASTEGELARLREAADNLERSYEASLTLLRAGELNVIDLLTTEEQLTRARLAVADAERRAAELQSRVLFESGRLLTEPDDLELFDASELELAATPARSPAAAPTATARARRPAPAESRG